MNSSAERRCSNCGEPGPFPKHGNQCKTCMTTKKAAWYQANKTKILARQRRLRRRRLRSRLAAQRRKAQRITDKKGGQRLKHTVTERNAPCAWVPPGEQPHMIDPKKLIKSPHMKCCCREHDTLLRQSQHFYQHMGEAGNTSQHKTKQQTGSIPGYEQRGVIKALRSGHPLHKKEYYAQKDL